MDELPRLTPFQIFPSFPPFSALSGQGFSFSYLVLVPVQKPAQLLNQGTERLTGFWCYSEQEVEGWYPFTHIVTRRSVAQMEKMQAFNANLGPDPVKPASTVFSALSILELLLYQG